MGDQFFQGIGLNQNQPATQGTNLQTPGMTMPELVFRTLASVPAQSYGRRGGSGGVLGIGQRLVGGFSGALADELARQRLDPLNRQLAVGQQLEAMGTKPLAPAPLSPDASFLYPARR